MRSGQVAAMAVGAAASTVLAEAAFMAAGSVEVGSAVLVGTPTTLRRGALHLASHIVGLRLRQHFMEARPWLAEEVQA